MLQIRSIRLVQPVRQPAVRRNVVQVVEVDMRRVAHRDAAAFAEVAEARVVSVLVVVVHAMRLAHVRGRVVRHLRDGHPALRVSVANRDHWVRDRARVRGMPGDLGVEVQRLRHEDGARSRMVDVHGCVDYERAKEDRGHRDHTNGKHVDSIGRKESSQGILRRQK